MGKNQKLSSALSEDLFEPAWPYDMADSYMEQDLGEKEELEGLDQVALVIFKRPWFKQNYRARAKNNLRLYRRPYFHLAEDS